MLNKRQYTIIALVLFIILSIPLSVATTSIDTLENPVQILFISSYNSRFPTFFQQINGIKSILQPPHYLIDLEFMDVKRFNTPEEIQLFYTTLKYKLNHTDPYDYIIVGDDNAYNFALEHQNELFNNIPIIFLGVNNIENAKKANTLPLVTGVIENISMPETLNAAIRLYPNATHIYAIVDNTLGGQGDLNVYESLKSQFAEQSLEVLSLQALSFSELQDRLSLMTDKDIVLLLAAYSDASGTTVSFEKSLGILLEKSAVPIFHLYEHGIGDGLIGGKVVSHYEQGISAAQIVKAVEESHIDISEAIVHDVSPNKYLFDNNVLEKYGLDHTVLPDSTELLNQNLGLVDQYFDYILLFIIIVTLVFFFVVYLFYYITKCKSFERSLIDQNDQTNALYEELMASEEELRTQNDLLMDNQIQLEEQRDELLHKQKLIEDYAFYDCLTHLPNRHVLKLDVQKIVSKTSQNIIKGALFFIDFDNFKTINDHYGHTMGDEVLIEISDRLLEIMADHGKVYRFGGDEFIILIDSASDQDTLDFIAKKIFEGFATYLTVRDTELKMTFSMGIAIIPIHGNTYDDLIGSADMAMYAAKNSGKDSYYYFDEDTKKKSNYITHLKQNLQHALQLNQLVLHYQPIYDLKSKKIQFVEAMLRWQSPMGNIPPRTFIPMAIDMELMGAIQNYVFSEVCELSNILHIPDANPFITFNLSTKELLNALIITDLKDTLEILKTEPGNICLEISETIIENNFEQVLKQISELRRIGFRIIIDDFGAEYLSLNYLKKLPIDLLKIDISFFHEHGNDLSTLKALIEIIHDLDIKVIIKGIESDTHLSYLKNFDYQYVQGHYYGYPVTRDRIISMLLDDDIKIYHPPSKKL